MKHPKIGILPPAVTPEELTGLADDVRRLAHQIEAGEILALTWVEHRVNDKFSPNWIKSSGISRLELIGGVHALLHDMNKELLE